MGATLGLILGSTTADTSLGTSVAARLGPVVVSIDGAVVLPDGASVVLEGGNGLRGTFCEGFIHASVGIACSSIPDAITNIHDAIDYSQSTTTSREIQ